MRLDTRTCVFLHSDAVIEDCDCGVREYEVQLPNGWMWVKSQPPGMPFLDLQTATTYAQSLHPFHPDVTRNFMEDEWFMSPGLPPLKR